MHRMEKKINLKLLQLGADREGFYFPDGHSIYSLPPHTLFSSAINLFPSSYLLNSLTIYLFTLTLLPPLLKSLSLLTAHLRFMLVYYICFNLYFLYILIAALTLQIQYLRLINYYCTYNSIAFIVLFCAFSDVYQSSQTRYSIRNQLVFSYFGSS